MASNPQGLIEQLLSPQGVNGFQLGQQQFQDRQTQDASNQQALQLGAMKIQQAQQQQAQAQQYQGDVQGYFKDPTPENLSHLVAKYPDQYRALKASAGVLDDAQKTSQLSMNGITWNLAKEGPSDALKTHVSGIISAEKAAGIDTSDAQQALDGLNSPDAAQQAAAAKSIEALTRVKLSVLGAKGFEIAPDNGNGEGHFKSSPEGIFDDRTGTIATPHANKPEYEWDSSRGAFFLKPGTGGGGQASSGSGAAGSTGDVSRLLNSAAGGGQVPDSVQTLGQFVGYGKALNAKGAKSSSAGAYQINGSTMAQFAPQVLGQDWKSAPFNADSQEKVGQAIFDWAKQQPDPAKALANRWVSLNLATAAQLVKGDWNQARSIIAQGETGGGAGASASAPGGGGGSPQVVQVAAPKTKNGEPDDFGGDASLSGDAYLASLPKGKANYLRAIAAGQIDPPKAGTKYGNQVAEAAVNAFPNIDTSTFPARKATRAAFTGNGKAAQIGGSISRLGYHLNDAYEASQGLSGPNLGWAPLSNAVAGGLQSGEQAKAAKYDATLPFISGEVQKLVKNGAATEGEGNKIMANLSRKQPTDVRNAALAEIAKLATGAFEPYRQQWQSAFPGTKPPVDISPLSSRIYDHIINGKPPVGVDNNGHEVGAAPASNGGFRILAVRPK